MRPSGALRGFAEALDAANVRWCLLHDIEVMDSGELGSDVDMIVHPEDRPEVLRVLRGGQVGKVVQIRRYEFSASTYVVWTDEGEGCSLLNLDIAEDIRGAGRVFAEADFLLTGRIPDASGMYRMSPGREFAHYALKRALKSRNTGGDTFGEAEIALLRRCMEQDADECEAVAAKLLGPRMAGEVLEATRQGTTLAFEGMARRWCDRVVAESPGTGRMDRVRFAIGETARFARRVLRPEGASVAVIGPDGVGKSSVIGHLAAALGDAFASVTTMHLRPYALGRKKAALEGSEDPHGRAPYGSAKSVLKLAYWTFDYLVGYLSRGWGRAVRCGLTIYDRYGYDVLADPKRYSYGGSRWAARLMCALLPTPLITVVLTAPPSVLSARKQEIDEESLAVLVESYEGACASVPRCVHVSALDEVPQVSQRVVEHVLKAMAERVARRMGRWTL